MFGSFVVVAVGAAVAASPVTVVGWNSTPANLRPGDSLSDSVRVKPKARHDVVLQSSPAGAAKWRNAWRATTNKRGRVTVKFPQAVEGQWQYRLKIRGAGKVTSVRRVSVTAGTVPAPTPEPSASPEPTPPQPGQPTTVYVAGDIGLCPSAGGTPDKTAALVDAPVVVPGDLAYPSGTATDFATCYDPFWGRLKNQTYPVPGNHEYYSKATAYFAYFGDRVGTPARPWYAVDLGPWRFYMLNSNCSAVGGCGAGSPQYRWLVDQLSGPQPRCTAAVWHHPRWSSGQYGSDSQTADMYALLAANGAELLLSGHEHDYERFAPLTPDGAITTFGIRQFVVGTGGHTLRRFAATAPGSEARLNDSTGVLRMRLGAEDFSWDFLPTKAGARTDSGSAACG